MIAPVGRRFGSGNPLSKRDFTISGTSEANSTVELFEEPTSLGASSANASGEWSKSLAGVPDGSHTYTARATDDAGNTSDPSNPLTVEVTTVTAPPKVDSFTPTQTTGVPRNTVPTATFSTGMDASTITATTINLQVLNKRTGKWTRVAHTVGYDALTRTAKIAPGSTLAARKKYRVTVSTGVEGSTGVALDQDGATPGNQPKKWTFTTRR